MLGFRFWVSGFRFWILGFRFRFLGLGFKVLVLGLGLLLRALDEFPNAQTGSSELSVFESCGNSSKV